MIKIRIGLLVTLVILSMASIAMFASSDAGAAVGRGAAFETRAGSAGPSTEGEPDVGQTGKELPKTKAARSVGVGGGQRGDRGGLIRWIGWTSGVWVSSYLRAR